MEKEKQKQIVEQALAGNSEALEMLLKEVNDLVFNLSLRMLGGIEDAKDATQEILIRVITKLSTFQQESSFQTWVYRIASNYLINYQKTMFAKHPLSFEFYEQDIRMGYTKSSKELFDEQLEDALSEELKLSCTNVMLQCLDASTRCIFVLGTMFHVDSRIASQILDITPELYRQRLSRARKKMASFLYANCGLSETGICQCKKRIQYAISSHRLDPTRLAYSKLQVLDEWKLSSIRGVMQYFEDQMPVFEQLPMYESEISEASFISSLVHSDAMTSLMEEQQ